ncbi:MAG TPA: thioesterase family protein [Plasticicumulans sp.]|nr:thioesterase family protein [Plasticicumulans sp.]
MARVKLDLPATFAFRTSMQVRVGDINYGRHLGNDALLGLLHEARVRWLAAHGQSELDCWGAGLIMVDSVIVYRAEAFLGETLLFDVATADVHGKGCDLVYRVSAAGDGRDIAHAKTGILFFDYATRRVRAMPEEFRSALCAAAGA